MPRALLRCSSGKSQFCLIDAASPFRKLGGTGLTVCVSVCACAQQEQSQHRHSSEGPSSRAEAPHRHSTCSAAHRGQGGHQADRHVAASTPHLATSRIQAWYSLCIFFFWPPIGEDKAAVPVTDTEFNQSVNPQNFCSGVSLHHQALIQNSGPLIDMSDIRPGTSEFFPIQTRSVVLPLASLTTPPLFCHPRQTQCPGRASNRPTAPGIDTPASGP